MTEQQALTSQNQTVTIPFRGELSFLYSGTNNRKISSFFFFFPSFYLLFIFFLLCFLLFGPDLGFLRSLNYIYIA